MPVIITPRQKKVFYTPHFGVIFFETLYCAVWLWFELSSSSIHINTKFEIGIVTIIIGIYDYSNFK